MTESQESEELATESNDGLWRKLLFWKKKGDRLKLEDAKTAGEIRTAIIIYLRKHRNWYKKSGWRYTHSWHALTFLVIVLGALTSILTAMEEAFHIRREVLIILPALSSLFAAILVQFRLREGCRIRDSGRIAADELIGEAHGIDVKNRHLAMREALRLRAAAHRIEREQLSQFMAETPPPGRPESEG